MSGEFKTTVIRFTSRASVKIRDNYYTFEATIERQCDKPEDVTNEDYERIKADLWDEVNNEVDTQVQDVVDMLKSHK